MHSGRALLRTIKPKGATQTGLLTTCSVTQRFRPCQSSQHVPAALSCTRSSAALGSPHRHESPSLHPPRHARGVATKAASFDFGPVQAALLFELEGAVIDFHMDGHRQAFNKAFESIGYECISWPVHVYNDLLSAGDGSPEGLIQNYFALMGWPTMLATSDRPAFVRKVHEAKQAALLKMLKSHAVPLREGVAQVIQEALAAGAKVAFITGTLSEEADLVAANALAQLGPEVASKVRVFSSGTVPQANAPAEQEEEDGGLGGSVQSVLRVAQNQAKLAQARQFAASFAAGGDSGAVPMSVDPSLVAAGGARRVTPEWLAAVVATLDTPINRAALIASQSSLTTAACTAGMVAVAVPRRMAQRGVYDGVRAKFSGFGTGECTWGRLKSVIQNGGGN